MRTECVRANLERTHHSCSSLGPWDRHSSSFRCAGTLAAHCRVGTGQAELTVSPPAPCSLPAECQHCQILGKINPFWVLQEQGAFAQIPTHSTSIQIPVELEKERLPSVSGDKPCQTRTCHSTWASQGMQQQGLVWNLSELHETKSAHNNLTPYFSLGFVPYPVIP